MRVGWNIETDTIRGADNLSGTVGQISFKRLAEQLSRAGEVRPDQRIGTLMFNFATGLIQYTVEQRERR